jgi:hypothetical protein
MSKGSGALKDQLSGIADKVKTTLDEVSKNEAIKKAGEITQTIGEKAEGAKKVVGEAAETLGKSGAFKVTQLIKEVFHI